MVLSPPTSPDPHESLGRSFLEALRDGNGMNDFLHRILQGVGTHLAAPRLALYDYDELSDTFDLLYFYGYPADARSELRRRMHAIDPRRALRQREPYAADASGTAIVVPLHFQDDLEAILLVERPGRAIADDRRSATLLPLVSRFLGLFLSSMRLPMNQRRRVLAVRDLEKAREIQLSYLPVEYPTADRYEIFGYNQSAALVGGDYFDYFSERTGSIQCVVADACGHGLAAALIMSTFRGLLQAEVRRAEELPTLFSRLNARVFSGAGQIQYLTGVFLDYDESAAELRYWNAGHFEPILLHADGTHTSLCGGGLPLGMFEDSRYEMCSSRIAPGDLLVLFTDGLAELRNADDQFFGIEGILDATLPSRHLPLRDVATHVLDAAGRFCRDENPDDDLTLFLMRFR
jgi:sigma-B regulation protein RsbU (phosphoserine phosphatase)